jgi:hypothetical protein
MAFPPYGRKRLGLRNSDLETFSLFQVTVKRRVSQPGFSRYFGLYRAGFLDLSERVRLREAGRAVKGPNRRHNSQFG